MGFRNRLEYYRQCRDALCPFSALAFFMIAAVQLTPLNSHEENSYKEFSYPLFKRAITVRLKCLGLNFRLSEDRVCWLCV